MDLSQKGGATQKRLGTTGLYISPQHDSPKCVSLSYKSLIESLLQYD